jgi:hypothetical protein
MDSKDLVIISANSLKVFLTPPVDYSIGKCYFLVTEKKIGNKTVFLCDICGLGYADRATAQECEDYCRAHRGSCSAAISKKAVYLPGAPTLPEKE